MVFIINDSQIITNEKGLKKSPLYNNILAGDKVLESLPEVLLALL